MNKCVDQSAPANLRKPLVTMRSPILTLSRGQQQKLSRNLI